MRMRSWPWISAAWIAGAAAALPLAAPVVPGLPPWCVAPSGTACLLLSAVALAVWGALPCGRLPRIFAFPSPCAALVFAWLAWTAMSPGGVPWAVGLLLVSAALQFAPGDLPRALSHLLGAGGLGLLALPILGIESAISGWQRLLAGGMALLAGEALLIGVLAPGREPLAALIARGPRLVRRWALRAIRLSGMRQDGGGALRPVLRVLPWAACATAVAGFSATAVTAIRPAERGVYLRCGAPVAVLPGGVHVHLPWPFGRVVRVDGGIERRLSLSGMELDGISHGDPDGRSTRVQDRQWHRAHGREVFFLTAADRPLRADGGEERRGIRLCEIINADVVLHWRIGGSDADAVAAALRIEQPEVLLAALARRWVQGVFAAETPGRLLGADRASLADRMRDSLAAELTRLGTGMTITVVSFEAVHPPLAAAPAFLAAQGAERGAAAAVAVASARREVFAAEAQIEAVRVVLSARAEAAERLSAARTESVAMTAEREAWRTAPGSVAFEHRLAALRSAAEEGRYLTIIDHRLPLPLGLGVDLAAPMRPRHVK